MDTCIHFTLHDVCGYRCVCADCSTEWASMCVCISSVPGIISVNVCVWSSGQPPAPSLLSFSSLPKRDAKRGKVTAFSPGAQESLRQKAQIKQMLEIGLESQPLVRGFERERTAAGVSHLGLSVQGPHRYTHLPAFSPTIGPHTLGCQFMCTSRVIVEVPICHLWPCLDHLHKKCPLLQPCVHFLVHFV